MLQVKIVLCPVDFSDIARDELALAVEVCETFGAHLALHHNRSMVAPGLGRGWEWNETHRGGPAASPEEQINQLIARLPKSIAATASVSEGPVGLVLTEVARQLPADLVVMGSHGWSTPDHASVTERIMEECPCPVLTVHDGTSALRFRMRSSVEDGAVHALVPTDLGAAGLRAVQYAFEISRQTRIDLRLLHVLPSGHEERAGAALQALNELIPPDLESRVRCDVAYGRPIEQILGYSRESGATFLVMGEHARSFFARQFTRDTAREALHRAPCPVWFVP